MGRARLWMLLSLAPVLLLEVGGEAGIAGPTPVRASEPAPQGFDPSVVQVAPDSAERAVRDALEAGDNARAVELADAALSKAEAASAGRLLWLAAQAEAEPEKAELRYTRLAASAHPLSRWAALRCAEILHEREPARAAAIASGLRGDWAGAGSARVVEALAYHAAGDFAAAEPLLRELLAEQPQHSGAATSAMPLATILEARGTPDALEEALSLYRRVSSRAPLSEVGKEASASAVRVLSRLPPARRAALNEASVEDEFHRGRSLLTARYYDDARTVFEALGKRVTDDSELRCQAELEAGRALVQKRERKLAAEHMRQLAGRCGALDVKAWARYYGGRAFLRSGSPAEANAELAALVAEAPAHRLADDALQMQATAFRDSGDPEAARNALRSLVERYPEGDMRSEARFALAFDARERGEHAEALSHLDASLAEGPEETAEGEQGRAAYWRARTLVALGRRAEAVAAYEAVVQAAPLGYHAQQARARLRELAPKKAARLAAELGGLPQPAPLRFPQRAEMEQPAFARAVELMRVGELELARRELAHMGALGSAADKDLLWLAAALFERAGAHAEASRLVRSRLRGFDATVPQGRAAALWRLAYPNAFAPLIEEVAGESGVPASFIRAVAREESAFDPTAVSSARAYGLIQLIVPTARAHAKVLGLPSDPASLKRPEVNLRIGAHFIRELWRRYADNPALVPSAYNAGHGAANRWLSARPGLDLDEWIERIPYSETRRYTRRVLQTYGIYSFLETGKLPELPKKLPKLD